MSNYGWIDLPPELSNREIRIGGDVISGSGPGIQYAGSMSTHGGQIRAISLR